MKYKKVAPMLLVDDVDRAMTWYQDILGASLQYSLPKKPPYEWVSLLIGDVEIMLSQKKAVQKWYTDRVQISEKPSNFIIYIYINNIDGLYNQIKDKVNIILEPIDQWYGVREFAIHDPFGFSLIFAQAVG